MGLADVVSASGAESELELNYCRAGGWALLSAGLVLAAASCDDGHDTSEITAYNRPAPSAEVGQGGPGAAGGSARCVPGETRACIGVCGGFGLGYQICAADGRSYDACVCEPGAPIDSIDGPGGPTIIPPRNPGEGLPPVQVPGGVPPASLTIGAECERDADCGGSLVCFGAGDDSLGFGGPGRGYCSMGCDEATDCTAVDRTSTCGTVAGRSLCLHACRAGEPGELADKCLGRPDLMCLSSAALGNDNPDLDAAFGICIPMCQSDAGCGGRRCDLSTGLCTDEPRAGDPIGAACTGAESCAAGICLGATETSAGFCSSFCTIGVPGCGYDGSEASAGAACLLPQITGEGAGDRGLCFALCDVAEDCAQGFDCVPEPTSARGGVCLPQQGPAIPVDPGLPHADGLAAACEDDADCEDGLICLSSDDDPFGLGGGPPEGYCSSSCDSAEDCPPGSGCAQTDGGGYCFATCEPEDPEACGSRETAPCEQFGAVGVCQPDCSDDAQCGERVCDDQLGLCVDAPVVGPECSSDDDCAEGVCDAESGECVPQSAPGCSSDDDCAEGVCDVESGECVPQSAPECTADDDCEVGVCEVATGTCSDSSAACVTNADCGEGVCNFLDEVCIESPPVPIGAACSTDTDCIGGGPAIGDPRGCFTGADSGFCSALCSLSTERGCEVYGADAVCLLPIQGDFGACLQLCNVPEDCEQEGYRCLSIGGEVDGRTGACLPPAAPAAAPQP
jgi:hypothetical protein